MSDIFKDYTLKEDGSWYEFYLEAKDEEDIIKKRQVARNFIRANK